MSNVISLAQRMALQAQEAAEEFKRDATEDDGIFDAHETSTYRKLRVLARKFEHYADLRDALDSAGHTGMTPRNVRRLRDYMDLDDSIA